MVSCSKRWRQKRLQHPTDFSRESFSLDYADLGSPDSNSELVPPRKMQHGSVSATRSAELSTPAAGELLLKYVLFLSHFQTTGGPNDEKVFLGSRIAERQLVQQHHEASLGEWAGSVNGVWVGGCL